jgi:hypothetical protein
VPAIDCADLSAQEATHFKLTAEPEAALLNNAPSEFDVWNQQWNPQAQKHEYYRNRVPGREAINKKDIRGRFISENQNDYPEPTGGCGPTALLNLYVWYKKSGLLTETTAHADPRLYKQLKFQQIDQAIREMQGPKQLRSDGTNSMEQVLALDELVQVESKSRLRISAAFKRAPLQTKDFLELNLNYRAGILAVQVKDRNSPKLLNYHVVLVIRSDRTGKITIANWGEFSLGRLVQRGQEQWFIPDNPEQHELRVLQLTSIIPFSPTNIPDA